MMLGRIRRQRERMMRPRPTSRSISRTRTTMSPTIVTRKRALVRPRRTGRHARTHDRNHPYGVALRVANVGDHLIEVRERHLARDRRQLTDRVDIAVAPRLEDRCECLARHA